MYRQGLASALIIVALFIISAESVRGATFCVSTSAELQSALTAAASNGEDDAIHIVQGTYLGSFIYASTEARNLNIGGGYTTGCNSQIKNPDNTILDAQQDGVVLALSTNLKCVFALEGLTLRNGYAVGSSGGGLFAQNEGSIIIKNNNFSNNRSRGEGGGGIYCYTMRGNVVVRDNKIAENQAATGGGVYIYTLYGTALLINNTITCNLVPNSYRYLGGGVAIKVGGDKPIVELINNTIAGNVANEGGGIWFYSYGRDYKATFCNNTITNNSSSRGGGIACWAIQDSGIISFYNNIIIHNVASEASDLYLLNDENKNYLPVVTYLFNNNFDQSSSGTYSQIPFTIDPSNLNNEDPLFIDPDKRDYHLQLGSPCIDTGNNAAPNLPLADIEGKQRIWDGTGSGTAIVDMGAYEFNSIYPLNMVAICTGDFADGGADEFAIAEKQYDSTIVIEFYDSGGKLIGQASAGVVQEMSLASGNFDDDAQDEVVLACVMEDGTLAAMIFEANGTLKSTATGGQCSNVTVATGQFDADKYNEYVVTLLQADQTLGAITFNHDGSRVGKGTGGVCSNLNVASGNFDSDPNDDEYVISLLQSDGTLAAITFQGNGTRIGKGTGGLCSNVNVAAGNFRSDNDPQDEYVVSLIQSDGTLAAISFYGNGTRIGKGVGGICTNVNIASGAFNETDPLKGYVVSLNQADDTPAAIFFKADGTRIGKGTGAEVVMGTDIACGDIDGDGWYDEAVLAYINQMSEMKWIVFTEYGGVYMSGP